MGKRHGRAQKRSEAQRGAHAFLPIATYSRPEVRRRVTGSLTGIGCRLKTQRATAMPSAA